VKRELFDRAWGEFFGSSSRTTSTALGNGMGEGGGRGGGLEGMEELLIVWRDWRVVREAWGEKEGVFREVGESEVMGRGRDNEFTGFLVRMCRERFGEGEGKRGVRIRMGVVE